MQTVADILVHAVKRTPEAIALISNGQKVSYRELLGSAMAVGTGLRSRGIKRGDRIMTLLQNHQSTVVLHWAAQLYGIAISPLNWRTTAIELAYFADDCGAKAIFYDPSSRDAVEAYASTTDVLVAEAPPDGWSGARDVWPHILHATPDPLPNISGDDVSVILYTSGTTGRGKGVPRTHRAERAAAMAHVAQNALLFEDVTLGVMPLYHTMGVRLLLSAALLSGRFVCQPKFCPDETLALIESHDITSLYLVPTLYHDMLAKLDQHPRELTSIRRLGFAGASMSDGLLKRLTAAFPDVLKINHYGSSEIYTYTITQNPSAKPGSAGKAGLNSQVAVIPLGSDDVTARVSAGQEGQVIASMRSDEAFSGYLNRPDVNATSFRDGWFLTGDVGFLDDEGELFLTGRVDDMIITGGENVMPIEIESVLSLHPNVDEVVVVGREDERLGQKLVACVVANGQTCASVLDSHCRSAGLPGYRCPKDYEFVESIPKSPVGKVLRRLL